MIFFVGVLWGSCAKASDCIDFLQNNNQRIADRLKYDPDRFFISSIEIPLEGDNPVVILVRNPEAAQRLREKLAKIDPAIDIAVSASDQSDVAWSVDEMTTVGDKLRSVFEDPSALDRQILVLLKVDSNAFIYQPRRDPILELMATPMSARDFAIFKSQLFRRIHRLNKRGDAISIGEVDYQAKIHVGFVRLEGRAGAIRDVLAERFSFLVDATLLKTPSNP